MQGKDRTLVLEAIEQMTEDPFAGDVKSLSNDSRSAFRRRVGAWRILFDVESDDCIIIISAILRRTTTTYRKR